MAITNFIPEVWADSTIDRWVDRAVLPNLVNREYEGTPTRGNTVHLTGVVTPDIKDYKANGRISTPDAISDTQVDLLIDQEKEFSFYVDDVDRAQAAGSLDVYTDAAGDGLVTDANKALAVALAEGGTALSGSAPTTGDTAFNLVRDGWKALSKAKAPMDNRVLACNSEFGGLLLGADSKLTAFDTSGDGAGLREATIGRLLGFRVVVSDDLPEVDTPAFVAFHSRAAAFVGQVDSVEALRATNKFADIVRGLHVYGSKVVKQNGVWVFGIGNVFAGTGARSFSLQITGSPTGGTYTLSVGGVASAAIAYNADAATVAAALNAIVGVSGATVTGTTTKTVKFETPLVLTGSATGLTGGTSPAVVIA